MLVTNEPRLGRRASHRLRPPVPGPFPDIVGPALSTIHRREHLGRGGELLGVRVLLGVIAAVQFAVAIPALLGDGAGEHAHVARHVGVFGVSVAVAFAISALAPRRAQSFVPMIAVLIGALLVTSALDVAAGRVPIAAETVHVPQLLGGVCVCVIAHIERLRARRLLAS